MAEKYYSIKVGIEKPDTGREILMVTDCIGRWRPYGY